MKNAYVPEFRQIRRCNAEIGTFGYESGDPLEASVDPLSDAFWNSQRDVPPPRLRSLMGDGDDSRLLDKEAPDRAFAEKPKLRYLGYGVVPLKCLETYRLLLEFWVGRRVLGCLSEFHKQSLLVRIPSIGARAPMNDRDGICARR